MSSRGSRKAVERGIYKSPTGYEVVAWSGRLRRSCRFPLDTDRDRRT